MDGNKKDTSSILFDRLYSFDLLKKETQIISAYTEKRKILDRQIANIDDVNIDRRKVANIDRRERIISIDVEG